MTPPGETTRLLKQIADADPAASERLFTLVYHELRALAGDMFRNQRADHTLQPTALVNEAFLRLVDDTHRDWNSRAHFIAVAAKAMRQILVDHARAHARLKRGGGAARVTLSDIAARPAPTHNPPPHATHPSPSARAPRPAAPVGPPPDNDLAPDILDLDLALEKLAQLDPRQSRIVELRFFGGLTVAEVAQLLELSKSTIEAEWRMASAWLRREMSAKP